MDFERQALMRADMLAQRKLLNCIIDSVTTNVTQPHLLQWKDGYVAGLKAGVATIDAALAHFDK